MAAERLGLIEPVPVGPRARIDTIAEEKALDLSAMEIVGTSGGPTALPANRQFRSGSREMTKC